MEHRPLFRLRTTALVSLVAFVFGPSGCTSLRWQARPITEVGLGSPPVSNQEVRVFTPDGVLRLHVSRIDFPFVYGSVTETSGAALVGVDLREVSQAEVITIDPARKEHLQRSIAADEAGVSAVMPGTMRLTTSSGVIGMAARRVEAPWVYGVPDPGTGQVRVDLREARRLEVGKRSLDVTRTVGLVLAGAILVGIIVGTVAAVESAQSGDSCPVVYVDRGAGWEKTGLAYVGAAFRSIQRDDLLPLPSLTDGEIKVRLRDEAHETEYTDRAELLVVDHAVGVRPLAAFDGQVVFATEGAPPQDARHAGRPVTTLIEAAEGSAWETDVVEVSQAKPPFGEELTATFDAPVGPGSPVLEIVGGNTLWMDVVFDRFFAAMGGRLGKYLAAGNQPARRERLLDWRAREGVDLVVEVLDEGRFRRVAAVPTIGAEMVRRVAVPLPADAVRAGGPVTVRLAGGLGFWRIDQLALSRRIELAGSTRRLAPVSAVDLEGRDQRDLLAAADDRYQVLEPNQGVDLRFALPPLPRGGTRSAFLLTRGYYQVHAPIQGKWSPGTLRTIRGEPGGLSRFSRDLARTYVRLAERSPRTAEAVDAAASRP